MRIEDWYRNNGIFGNVKDDIDTRKKSLTTGEYVFDVEEVEIGEVRLRFVDKKGNEVTVCRSHTHCINAIQHRARLDSRYALHAWYWYCT